MKWASRTKNLALHWSTPRTEGDHGTAGYGRGWLFKCGAADKAAEQGNKDAASRSMALQEQ